jgi:hypothetical protein
MRRWRRPEGDGCSWPPGGDGPADEHPDRGDPAGRRSAHEGVNGAFVIADFADAPSIVYLETALTGLVVERPEDVAAVALSYETLRAEALSRSGSLDKLKQQHDR